MRKTGDASGLRRAARLFGYVVDSGLDKQFFELRAASMRLRACGWQQRLDRLAVLREAVGYASHHASFSPQEKRFRHSVDDVMLNRTHKSVTARFSGGRRHSQKISPIRTIVCAFRAHTRSFTPVLLLMLGRIP
jgi:hypothetical protein